MKQLILSFFLLIFSLSCFSQQNKLDNAINIDGSKKVLYSENLNMLVITSSADSIQNLIFKSSQGNLQNFDKGIVNGMFYISRLKPGMVTISVFKRVGTELLLKNRKTYTVIKQPLSKDEERIDRLMIKPILSIEGYASGQIPLTVAKQAKSVALNKPYRLHKATVYFGSNQNSDTITETLTSEMFNDMFFQAWKRIAPGTVVIFDNIEITDSKGNTYKLNPISFSIVE